MKIMNILAHRGWWDIPEEKNSPKALERALRAGFGIETDFRDQNTNLIISHDPPAAEAFTAADFFSLYQELGADGRLAINIKADGLQTALQTELKTHRISLDTVFAFDMSVPDILGYLRLGLPVYSRASEYENPVALADETSGVWIDNFTGSYPQIETAQRLLETGTRCCIVSPELHGRPHKEMWDDIRKSGIHKHPLVEICTDFPRYAHNYFGH